MKDIYGGTREGEQDGFAGRGSSAAKTPQISSAVVFRRGSSDTVLEPFETSPLIRSAPPQSGSREMIIDFKVPSSDAVR